ncbi:transcriptional regulator, TetR family [Pseudonocardia thermophila]|jgi:Transcriptional regulator|uniref:Transcriptional regulator, TetR family n=1 Tax=Pseudonocardia thermophila TaxID=1848 RepID=A0A1M6TQX2_PSETH|nr:TetR-like C-terminal domain-containing protein [Pseudonocardia thermophila]SHK59336.1 transcriptional regulator, TetR family [Pseudonocardia thermophila]
MARAKVHDGALRDRLLRSAGEIVSTGGVDALSLRMLARTCDTSTTAVYALFGGKDGLVTALFDEAFAELARRLAAVPRGVDPLDDVVRVGLAYRSAALAEPHLFALMFGGRTGLPPAVAARTATGTALGPLRMAVQRAIDEGALRADTDPAHASITLWTTVHGWVTLQLLGYLPPGTDARLESALWAVLEGWRAQ